jgi:hypothetical protein
MKTKKEEMSFKRQLYSYVCYIFIKQYRSNVMKKILSTLMLVVVFSSTIFLVGRPFRTSKVPHGSNFSCNTGLTNGVGSPLNAFGLVVESKVTPNGTESLWTPELAALDSDGDGFTNGEELQDPNGSWIEGTPNPGNATLVTNPGDANSIPTSIFDESNVFTFQLAQNYPNPFNPSTSIRYELKDSRVVTLKIYNSLGQEVKTLVNKLQSAGIYEVNFNATGLNSGVYFYSFQAGNFIETKKMTLLK